MKRQLALGAIAVLAYVSSLVSVQTQPTEAADQTPDLPLVTVGKFSGYGTTYVYWFANGDDECYLAYRTDGTAISCMKKGRE